MEIGIKKHAPPPSPNAYYLISMYTRLFHVPCVDVRQVKFMCHMSGYILQVHVPHVWVAVQKKKDQGNPMLPVCVRFLEYYYYFIIPLFPSVFAYGVPIAWNVLTFSCPHLVSDLLLICLCLILN